MHACGYGTSRTAHAVAGHSIRKTLCGTVTEGRKRILRQSTGHGGINRGGNRLHIACKVIAAHALTNTGRDVLTNGLHALRGGVNLQCGVQRSLQIGGHRLRVAVPSGSRHAFSDTLKDVCAGIRRVKTLKEGQNFLQILNILFRNLLALQQSGDNLTNISGQLRNALRAEIVEHALVQNTLIHAFAANTGPKPLPAAVIQRLRIGIDAGHRRTDQIHGSLGHHACHHAEGGCSELVNLIDER